MCVLPVSFSRKATAVNSPYSVGSRTEAPRSTSCSWRRRYSTRSATVIIFRPCRSQYGIRSGTRAIVPSSFMTSQTTPGGREPGEPREVDGRLRLADPLEHAARLRAEREHVAGLHEVAVRRVGVDRDLDRAAAVGRGDAGRHALARLDRHREGGAERRLVVVGHRAQPEMVGALLGQAEADEPARVRGHEVDRLGCRELRGDDEVALVLAVGVVDDDDQTAFADVFDRLLDGRERCGDGHRAQG